MRNSRYLFLAVLFLVACAKESVQVEKVPEIKSQVKESVGTKPSAKTPAGLKAEIQARMPKGWTLSMESFKNHTPSGWKKPAGKGFGLKIVLANPGAKKKILRPYASFYPDAQKYIEVYPRMTRYLFTQLESGYEYQKNQRMLPDQLVAVTADFIIISPSATGEEADYEAASMVGLFEKIIGISSNWQEEFAVITHLASMSKEAARQKNQEAKALIINKKNTSSGVGLMILPLK